MSAAMDSALGVAGATWKAGIGAMSEDRQRICRRSMLMDYFICQLSEMARKCCSCTSLIPREQLASGGKSGPDLRGREIQAGQRHPTGGMLVLTCGGGVRKSPLQQAIVDFAILS